MAELKTKVNDASVTKFLDSIEDETKRKDSYVILEMMRKATKAEPRMWGDSIIGFGDYRYAYASGREGDWFLAGFSPRKQNLTLYAMCNGWDRFPELKDLGKYTLGKGCLYIKRLSDVDMPTLRKLVNRAVRETQAQAQREKKK